MSQPDLALNRSIQRLHMVVSLLTVVMLLLLGGVMTTGAALAAPSAQFVGPYPPCATDYESLGDFLLPSGFEIVFDTDADALTFGGQPGGVIANGYAVFAFDSFEVEAGASVQGVGELPLIILSQSDIIIDGTVSVSSVLFGESGAGAQIGGSGPTEPGEGPGGGQVIGGGGGHAGVGGAGGAGGAGGSVYADPENLLTGGSGGAGGDTGVIGGAGGGALLLGALGDVEIGVTGEVLANGARGDNHRESGGGGGSGGMILVHAQNVTNDGSVSAVGRRGGNDGDAGPPGTGGGGGGGGFIVVSFADSIGGAGATSVSGGDGGDAEIDGTPGQPGDDGTVVIRQGYFPDCELQLSIEKSCYAAETELHNPGETAEDVVIAGQQWICTVEVTNHSPVDAEGVRVRDRILQDRPVILETAAVNGQVDASFCTNNGEEPPFDIGADAARCNIGTVPAGGTVELKLGFTVSPYYLAAPLSFFGDAPSEAPICNQARITRPDYGDEAPIAEECDIVKDRADLRVTKIANSETVPAGEPIEYWIVVENWGPSAARGVAIKDIIYDFGLGVDGPEYYSIRPTALCGAEPATDYGLCILETPLEPIGEFGIGGQWHILVTSPDGVDEPTTLTNKVDVFTVNDNFDLIEYFTGTPDQDTSNNSATTVTVVEATSDLGIEKEDLDRFGNDPPGEDRFPAGGFFMYAIEVTNDGPSDAVNVVVEDPLPAGLTLVEVDGLSGSQDCDVRESFGNTVVTCLLGTLERDESQEFTLLVQSDPDLIVDGTFPLGMNLQNTACTTSDNFDPDNSDNCELEDTIIFPFSLVEIDKSVSRGDNPVTAGEEINYKIEIFNNGPSTLHNLVIKDDFAGAIDEYVTLVSVNIADGPGICYFEDFGRKSLICTLEDMKPFEWRRIDFVVAVDPSTPGGSMIDNVVNPEANPFYTLGPSDLEASVPVVTDAELVVTKTADDVTPEAGEDVVFEIVVSSLGPSTAANVQLTDTLPADLAVINVDNAACRIANNEVTCDLGDLRPGEDAVVTISARVAAGAACGASLVNEVAVAADNDIYIDFVPDQEPVIIETPVEAGDVESLFVDCRADLKLQKFVKPDGEINAGDPFTFTIFVDNLGLSAAADLTVEDVMFSSGPFEVTAIDAGAGTCTESSGSGNGNTPFEFDCTLATLGLNERWTITVNAIAYGEVDVNNDARVYAASPRDPDFSNNADSASMSIGSYADLKLQKFVKPDGVITAGQPFQFIIFVDNQGISDATGLTLNDTMFSSGPFTVNSISDDRGATCTPTGGGGDAGSPFGFSCELDALATNERWTVTVDVVASAELDVNNEARVYADAPRDPDMRNNSDTAFMSVGSYADIALQKFVKPDGAIGAGEPFQFIVFVDNHGVYTATDVLVQDTIFSSGPFTVNSVTADSGAICTPTGGGGDVGSPFLFTCEIAELGLHARATIVVDVVADDTVDINNEARAHAATPRDPNLDNNADTASMRVSADADVGVTKLADTPTVSAGEQATWTVTVSNNGPSTAVNVRLSDVLPAAILPNTVTATPDVGACIVGVPGDATNPIVCNLGNLTSGQRVDVVISGQVDPNYVGGEIVNNVSVGSDTNDSWMDNNIASSAITVGALGALNISKQSLPGVVKAGEPVAYMIDVLAGPPSTAFNVVLSDTIPAEMSYNGAVVVGGNGTECTYAPGPELVTCVLGDMAPGESRKVQIHVTVKPGTPPGTVTNVAEVTSATNNPPAGDSDSADTIVVTEVGLSALKRSSSQAPATGEVFHYAVSVTNNGPSMARNVRIYDELTGSVRYLYSRGAQCTNSGRDVFCSLGDLGVGETIKFDIVVQVKDWVKDGHRSTNVIEVTSDTPVAGGQPIYAYSENIVFRNVNDLQVRKFGKPDGRVGADEQLVYTILVDNFGPGVAYNVAVTDLLASNGSYHVEAPGCSPASSDGSGNMEIVCERDELLPGEQWRLTVTVTTAEPQTVNNTADVEADGTDLDTSNNHAVVEHEVEAVANLEVKKTVNRTAVDAGGELTYAIWVKNHGPSTAYNVRINDLLPAGVTVTSVDRPRNCALDMSSCVVSYLEAGKSFEVEFTVDVDPNIPHGTELVNVVHVVSDAFDDQMSNNASSVKTVVNSNPLLHIIKTSVPETVYAGALLIYEIEVKSVGASVANNVEIRDPLPDEVHFVGYETTAVDGLCIQASAIICRLGDMAPGESEIIALTVRVDPGAAEGSIVNTLREPTLPYGGKLEAVTKVEVEEKLWLEFSASVASVEPGEIFAYDVLVRNEGSSTLRNVKVDVLLPDLLSYVSDTIGCGPALSECSVGDLEPGQSRSFQILVQLDPNLTGAAALTATANASANSSTGVVSASQSTVLIANSGQLSERLFMPLINR